MRHIAALAIAVAACGDGSPPDLIGLSDQIALVGQPFMLELQGVDPDGDRLNYTAKATVPIDGAAITQTPSGTGLFRWTPLATDIGQQVFDFIVSDGSNDTTVSIVIDVRDSSTAPIFRQPLGTGRVVNLGAEPCIMVPIVVEDADTAQLTIGAIEIPGATLMQSDGTSALWRWCPTPAQVADKDRYTLTLFVDDGDNPKTVKDYILVLGMGSGPQLVINDVDYDNLGTDSIEYVEIYNPSTTPTSLSGLHLVLINGSTNAQYANIDLTSVGSLGAGKYLVIAGSGVYVPSTQTKLNPVWTQDQVQNGAPDGVALVDTVTTTLVDALSYEGAVTAAVITGFTAPVSLVEGTVLPATVADSNDITGSICRYPNGQDTNNAANDWRFCGVRTAGSANIP